IVSLAVLLLFGSPGGGAEKTGLTKEKEFVFKVVERNSKAIALLGDNIYYFAELGMQEFETTKLMTQILQDAGFKVERGISGMPTAFVATYGSGKPVVAIHTEYDTTPGNSQTPGVPEHKPLVEGAPGHAEGHNVNAAVMIGAAFAVKKAIDQYKIPGTLKIFGAPAEELLIPRPYFVRDGYFNDVDVAFHTHIGEELRTEYGVRQYALISAEFTFKGQSAHSASAPWAGRDALDAAELMSIGFDKLREHLEPTHRSHRVITQGGDQPNVIPSSAKIWWFFREATIEKAQENFEKAKRVAQGAALMTNTEYSVQVFSAIWPTRGNRTLAEVTQKNIELVGMPKWTEDEQNLAKALQKNLKAKPEGLHREISPLRESRQSASSNDAGEVTWIVPTGRVTFPANIPGIPNHHWAAGVAPATSIAHKGAVAGAKVLAASALDFLMNPKLVDEAKATFAKETAGFQYRSFLPADQKPPIHFNKELMERYRPLLSKYYLKEKPKFE
ncbi:MAG TPA: amidohydrolase, partial [Candidatus Eisenbacteria bacterium]|nr:amidohydrolase [Candidatus Eisenbacteria bacterium]